MSPPPAAPADLLVVLTSLCAEGTPVLTLDLCRRWQAWGLRPVVATMADAPRDLAPEFRAAGIELVRLGALGQGVRRYPQLVTASEHLCRALRPRGVLSMPLGWHGFILGGARLAGVRFTAAHVGNLAPHEAGLAFEKFRFLVQAGRPFTSSLICCSRYVEESVHEHFRVPGDETTVIYNGVPVAEVAARASLRRASKLAAPGRPFVVGMVARLEVHKDQPTLIRAAALCQARGVPLEVWLVGEGSRRAEYEQLVTSLGLGATVRLLGMRRDIPELLAEMDAFVFAAKPDEGLGVALIEAMAARVPIVATNVGACREVLDAATGSPLGTLIPAADPEALAGALADLARRPPDRALLERAFARALDVFSIEGMARRYASVLGFADRFSNGVTTAPRPLDGIDRQTLSV